MEVDHPHGEGSARAKVLRLGGSYGLGTTGHILFEMLHASRTGQEMCHGLQQSEGRGSLLRGSGVFTFSAITKRNGVQKPPRLGPPHFRRHTGDPWSRLALQVVFGRLFTSHVLRNNGKCQMGEGGELFGSVIILKFVFL